MKQICTTSGTLKCVYIYIYVCMCIYIYAASDDAADFPVFENKIGEKQTARSPSPILFLYNLHVEGELCRSSGKRNLFKDLVFKKQDT